MKKRSDPNRYPKGLTHKKVVKILAHYKKQSDTDAIAEAEAAYRRRKTTMIEVPVALLPQVRKLIAKKAG